MSKVLDRLTRFFDDFDESPEGYGTQLRLDFAEIIWRSLARNKWSQRRLSRESGLADSVVSNLIHGNKNCTLDTVGKVLYTLGTKATLSEPLHLDASGSAPGWRFHGTTGDPIEIQHEEQASVQTSTFGIEASTRVEDSAFRAARRQAAD